MQKSQFQSSLEYQSEFQKIVSSGANSPGRLFNDVETPPLIIKRAESALIEDVDGNNYIDFVMGLGPCILGHNPFEVSRAIKNQVDDGSVYGMSSKVELELASEIVNACDHIDQIRFTCSGTEAVMTALRVARAKTNKPGILKFSGGYHGHADTVLVGASKSSIRKKVNGVSDGIHDIVRENTLVCSYNDTAKAKEIIEQSHDRLAAIILEPIPSNMGLILPNIEFLKTLRSLCDKHQIVLIFDEVVSGFRFCFGSVSQKLGIQPDLITFGKIIGGGLGIGAYGGRKVFMDAVGKHGGVFQGGTFAGNPLTMAAGLATLKVLKQKNFYDKLSAKAELFAEITKAGFKRNGLNYSIQQYGPLVSYIINNELKALRSFADVEKQDDALFSHFHFKMVEKGILFPPTIEEPIFFSAAHTDEQVRNAAECGIEVLTQLNLMAA